MPLSRADFTAIASALASTRPEPHQRMRLVQWERDCLAVASALSSTNPRFRRDQFLAACGLPTSE